MEPQKVEVPMSGCIMVPTASPQSRSVPMPTYEAPLVRIFSLLICVRLKILYLSEMKIINQNTLKRR